MRKGSWSIVVIIFGIMMIGAAGWAMPQPSYFCQDDFTLTFGAVGNPLVPGTTIDADGRLLFWNEDQVAAWFTVSAAMSQPGQVSNGMWTIVFDSGTINIATDPTGGTTLWAGTVDHFTVTGYVDPSLRFNASAYPRPTYETEPTEFIGVGAAAFARTAGTWTDPKLFMDWVGSYNWNFDANTPEQSSTVYGNLQGRLCIPEPDTAMALACGLVGLTGLLRKRRT
jgi:hypothetical protein